ncbi:MAG: site-specific integrase [Ruminococcaceae bacterium]|nr:site-specific integrase [Oscillospiraceae bacterium]
MKPIKKTDKRGNIYYKIGAVDGYHEDSTQYRKFTYYYPEPGMRRADMERELRIRQAEWEQEVRRMHDEELKKGVPRNKGKQIFYDYALSNINQKFKSGDIKDGSVVNYRHYLDGRIKEYFGNMRLSDITTAQIDAFLTSLREPGVRKDVYARPIVDLAPILSQKGLTRAAVARKSGLTPDTVENVVKASAKPQDDTRFAFLTAQKIAEALDMPMESIFQTERNMAPLADKTILEHYVLLQTFFGYAKRKGHIAINPMEAVDRPKFKPIKVEALTASELQAVQDVLALVPESQIRWKVFVVLLIVTAARRAETAGFQWRHIDFKNGLLIIEQQLLGKKDRLRVAPTKEDDYRPIKLADEVLELLREYRAWYRNLRESYIAEDGTDLWRIPTNDRMKKLAAAFPPIQKPPGDDPVSEEDFLFVQQGGFPGNTDSINKWLKELGAKNQLASLHPHKFRHTAATSLFEKGLNIEVIAELLGHANSSVTETVYVDVKKKQKIRMSEALMRPFGLKLGAGSDKEI